MVNTHIVNLIQLVADAFHPPAVAVLFMCFPVIERIAPQLSGGAEIIGRHAGHLQRVAPGVQTEHVLVRPDVRTVPAGEDRNISNDGDAFFIGIFLQIVPLAVKQELDEPIVIHFMFQNRAPFFPLRSIRILQAVFPFIPWKPFVKLFSGHKQTVIRQPEFVAVTEGVVFFQKVFVCRMAETGIGLFQQSGLVCKDFFILHMVRVKCRNIGQVFGSQKLLLFQKLRADKERLTGKHGKTLVRRVSDRGRSQRQHLPQMLAGHGEKIDEIISSLPHVADAVGRREGSGMNKDATVAVVGLVFFCDLEMHGVFPPNPLKYRGCQ